MVTITQREYELLLEAVGDKIENEDVERDEELKELMDLHDKLDVENLTEIRIG